VKTSEVYRGQAACRTLSGSKLDGGPLLPCAERRRHEGEG